MFVGQTLSRLRLFLTREPFLGWLLKPSVEEVSSKLFTEREYLITFLIVCVFQVGRNLFVYQIATKGAGLAQLFCDKHLNGKMLFNGLRWIWMANTSTLPCFLYDSFGLNEN